MGGEVEVSKGVDPEGGRRKGTESPEFLKSTMGQWGESGKDTHGAGQRAGSFITGEEKAGNTGPGIRGQPWRH